MSTFDKKIKNKLEGAEMPVSEGLWANIESQIPVKKQKPKYWIFFLVAAFATPFLYYGLSTDKSAHQVALVDDSAVDIKESNDQANSLSLLSHNERIHTKSNNASVSESTDAKVFKSEKSQLSNNIQSTRISSDNSLASDVKIVQESSSLNAQRQSVHRVSPSGPISSQIESSLRRTSNETGVFSESGRPLSDFNQLDLSSAHKDRINYSNWKGNSFEELPFKSKKRLKFINNPFSTKQLKAGNTSDLKLIEESRIYQEVKKITPPQEISFLAHSDQLFSNSKSSLASAHDRMVRASKAAAAGCPTFQRFQSGIYAFADVKASALIQELEAKTPELVGTVNSRNKTEEELLSTSYTFGIGKVWNSGFIFESGINFDNISTKFLVTEGGRTVIETDTILLPDGTLEIQRDTSHIVGEGTKNKFNQINIPVRIGFDLPITERISVATKVGILVNLSSRNSGKLMTEGGTYRYSSTERSLSLFKTNLGLSYMAGMDVNMQLSSKIAGYAGIHCDLYPNNFGLSTYGIKQTYLKYGLTAGLKYSL